MVRRRTAAIAAAAASAVVVTQALHVSRRNAPSSNDVQTQKMKTVAKQSQTQTSVQKVMQKEDPTEFPTAVPDHVEPEGDGDFVTDHNTHDEEHRYEAEQHVPGTYTHEAEQAKLDAGGYRPHPPAPTPFIAASCAEICASDCAPQGFKAEMDSAYAEVMHGAAALTPQIVTDAVGHVGDYFKDIAESIVPGMNFGRKEHADEKSAKMKGKDVPVTTAVTTPSADVKDTSSSKTTTSFIQTLLRERKSQDCTVACEAAVHTCADEIDSSDSIPEGVEEYTTKPQISHCEDVKKLRFIAESGNLKWSMRFGQSPTFGQVAGLAEPYDLLTQSDLKVLAQCAEGGDFANLNLGNAIGLAKCMVGEVHDYAHSIGKAVEAAHAADTEDELNKEEMNPIAVDPVVEDEATGEFHMSEEVFYVNDVRCFTPCPGIKVQGVQENCEKHGHCATDFADLLWRTGVLYAPTTMANAVNDMGYAHATDPATENVAGVESSVVEFIGAKVAAAKAKLVGGTTTTKDAVAVAVAKPGAKGKAKDATPEAPEVIPPKDDQTSPLYDGKPTSTAGDHTPPFCKMQMCAPYPATWVQGDLLSKLYQDGTLERCGRVEEIPDVHPKAMYDGAMPEPKAPEALLQQTPVQHPFAAARDKAIERRQKTWAWSALKAGGYEGKDWPAAEAKNKEGKEEEQQKK